jgi:hypothetical protein
MTEQSELDRLRHDVEVFAGILTSTPDWLKPLADLTDTDRHARYLVVANLAWQIWEFAIAVELLLREELHASAIIVLRSAYETLVSLAYIANHNRSQDEAIICLAFSYIRQVEYFQHQADFVANITDILNRMPRRLVDEARKRDKTKPWTWSGLNMRQLAKAAKVTGYDEAYGYFSSESHGTMIGHQVRIVREADGSGRIQTGRKVSDLSVESAANMARRMFHSAFKTLWRVFDAPPITFPTTDPEAWVRNKK